MAKIDKVNPMCGCVMPVVPTIFSDGCLTLPEQVNKLTYKTNEVIEQTNQNTEYVNKSVENSETALREARNAIDEIPALVREGTEGYLTENGAPRLNPGATIDGVKFDGTKNITHIGVCNSAIDAVNKVINMLDGQYPDSLTNYLMLVKFSYGSNYISNATINIQGSEYAAIPIKTPYYNDNSIHSVKPGSWVIFAYNAGAFNVVSREVPSYSDSAGNLTGYRTINGTYFDGLKSITIACSTTSAASSNLKIIDSDSQSGVVLQNGSVILVRFLAGNTAEGAITFKIDNASAESKQVYYNGSTQGLPNLPSNATMLFVYANDSWIGSYVGTGGGSGEGYTLPPASATTLGGVKIGSGINVTADGVISANGGGGAPYELPAATADTLGGIKVGDNLTITPDGKLSANAGAYQLPVATSAILGGVKVGDGLNVTQDGKLSVSAGSAYELPIAGADTLGGVKVAGTTMFTTDIEGRLQLNTGNGLSISGTPTGPSTLNVAIGRGLEISNGLIRSKIASADDIGGVKVGGTTMFYTDINGLLGLRVGNGLGISGSAETEGMLIVNPGNGIKIVNGAVTNGYSFSYDSETQTLNITDG